VLTGCRLSYSLRAENKFIKNSYRNAIPWQLCKEPGWKVVGQTFFHGMEMPWDRSLKITCWVCFGYGLNFKY
jgi:hypothetical protein